MVPVGSVASDRSAIGEYVVVDSIRNGILTMKGSNGCSPSREKDRNSNYDPESVGTGYQKPRRRDKNLDK